MKILIATILAVSTLTVSAQHIHHLKVHSTIMNRDINTVVITPTLKSDTLYKTIYILHGYSGNADRTYKQDIPDLEKDAEKYQSIYVLPDGHYNYWYVDSPIDSTSQYQTFIGQELVSYIDEHFPTIKERYARGILGWSMGGYGALNIGISYAQTFSIVGSSCGALDFNRFGNHYKEYQVDKVLGKFENLPDQFFTFKKEEKMKTSGQYYILDCGTEDYQMLEMDRSFHQQLTKKNIQHLYIESKGKHDSNYWSKALSNQLFLFEKYFDEKL